MAELTIRNKQIISDLNWVRDKVLSADIERISQLPDMLLFNPPDAEHDGEKYLSEFYLNKHMNDPEHVGFPIEHMSAPFDRLSLKNEELKEVELYARTDFVTNGGANDNAVFLYYPPGGFVGWHTNQNNSGHQFIFSWSEKGDGYFQYYDKQKKEIIKLPDKAGWQARHFHFGQDEPDHCWHSAYTNVPRITICLLFRWWDKPDQKELILELKDQLIEEIESEY